MAADGYLNFNTKIDTKGFSGGVNVIEKSFDSMKTAFKSFAGAMGVALSTAALVAFGKKSLETAATVNASNSQLEQTFGSFKDMAISAMKRVADESGILETRLQSTGTSIYAFAKSAGMESTQALGMMEDALQVAADSAAYYDRSLEDVSETLKSYLKGNYANDAALGISSTEYTRNAKAIELYGKKFVDLSEAQKQLALLQMVKDANKLSGAMGQAARESEGWENVLGNLKESWRQLLSVIGQPVLKLAIPVVQGLTGALQNLTTAANTAWSALSKVMGWETQAKAIGAAADAQNQLTEAVEETAKAQDGALAGFDEIQTLSEDTAETATASGSGGILGAGETAVIAATDIGEIDTSKMESAIESIRNRFISLAEWIDVNVKPSFTNIFDAIAPTLPGVSESIKTAFGEAVENINQSISDMKTNLSNVFSDIGTLAAPLASWFSKQLPDFVTSSIGFIGSVVGGLFDSFNIVFESIWSGVLMPFFKTFTTSILPVMTELGTNLFDVFLLAFNRIKEIFDSVWEEGISPFLKKLMGYWSEAWDIVKAKWDEYGQPIFDGIKKAFNNIGDILMKVWKYFIKPVWDNFMETLDWLWEEHLKPLWENIVDFVGVLIENALIIFNEVISPIVSTLLDILLPVITNVVNTAWDIISSIIAGIIDVVDGLITFFKGVIKFVTGVFTGDWEKAWQGVCDMFKGVWDAIVGIAKTPINIIIDLINGMISGIVTGLNAIIGMANKISFTLPDGLGGGHFGFDIPLIDKSAHEIPKLATGAVIRPNREFLAVLGDQRQGTNIEAPLETMVQAFKRLERV